PNTPVDKDGCPITPGDGDSGNTPKPPAGPDDTTPPKVENPGDQDGTVDVPMEIPIKVDDETKVICKAENLPEGLTIDPATCVISGTPKKPGKKTVTVTVTDEGGNSTKVDFDITIKPKGEPTDTNKAPKVVNPGDQNGVVDTPVKLPIEVSDEGKVTCKAENLPEGLTIDPATCVISGTPKKPGSNDVTVTATDEGGKSTSVKFTFTVVPKKKVNEGSMQNGVSEGTLDGKQIVPSASGNLAKTGASAAALAGFGMMALSLGLITALAARRRKEQD
ncbi:MAG: Ig domain-containing protein, partial [Actinomycetaceae bacterium]|nr:Ig domain-containing protein [Actinomycetaceae bacterium]